MESGHGQAKTGEGSGEAGGPAGFLGPPDCREGPAIPRQDGASAARCEGPKSQHAEDIWEVLATFGQRRLRGYLECLASGGKSARGTAAGLQGVRFVEAAGEVRVEDCIGYSTVLDNFLREHEISGDQGTKEKGKAQRIPVMVLFAFELVV